jgi:hypothetical protein
MSVAQPALTFAALLGELGRRLDDMLAPTAPPTIVDATSAAEHVPGLTPRAFADGCRRGRWASMRAGRRRVARLDDVLAGLAASPPQRRRARGPTADDQLLADACVELADRRATAAATVHVRRAR